MTRRTAFTLATLAGLCWAGPLAAAESPVSAIPRSAGAVLRLKSPNQTIQKVVNFANQIDPKFGQTVFQLSQSIGVLVSNPARVGVDPDGDWWVATFPVPEGQPGVAFAIPATDAEAMKQAVGQKFQFSEYENWVLYTDDSKTAEKLKSRIGGAGESIGSLIDEKSRAVFDGGEASVYLNVRQLKKTYKPQLDKAKKSLEQSLEELPEQSGQVPGFDGAALAELAEPLLGGLLEAIDDTQSLTAALAVRPKRIAIEEYTRVKQGSPTDQFLQKHPASKQALLGQLPAGKLGYFGFGSQGDLSSFIGWAMKLTLQAYKNEETSESIQNIIDAYGDVKFGDIAGFFDLGNIEGGALRSGSVTEAEPIDKVRSLSRRTATLMGEVEIGGLQQEMALKTDAETYGQYSGDIITVKQEVDPSADPLGMQKSLLKLLYGPEGMVERIVYLEDKLAVTLGGGQEAMQNLLTTLNDESRSRVGQSQALQKTRQHVAPRANVVGFIDLPGTVAKGIQLARESGQFPLPPGAQAVQDVELEPSYLGISLGTEPQGLRLKLNLPVGQIRGFVSLFKAFQAAGQVRPGNP